MSRETKFGYGFLFAGTGMPYLIDKLLGPVVAIVVSAVLTLVGLGLLVAGHRHKDTQASRIKRKGFMATVGAFILVGALVGGAIGSIWWLTQKYYAKPEEVNRHTQSATDEAPQVRLDAYLQPGYSNPYPPQTILGGIIWDDKYVDVRLDIGLGATAIQNLDLEVALDTSIAGIGQISQFPGVTSFPTGAEMPPVSLEGADEKGKAVTIPIVPTQGLAQIAGSYRVHCNMLYSNTVLHLVLASVALNQATKGKLPQQLFAPRTVPRLVKVKGTFEVSSQKFPIDFEKRFDISNQAKPTVGTAAPLTPETAHATPEIRLRFVYPKDPSLIVVNHSGAIARDIKWTVALWNMNLPDRNDPLPIPVSSFDWLKPHTEGGPQNLFGTPSPEAW